MESRVAEIGPFKVRFMDNRTRIFLRHDARMRRTRRAVQIVKNAFLLLVALVVVFLIGGSAEFAYRTNSICSPGDHIIQSEADAIEVAKKKIVKDSHLSSESFGSAPDFVDALSETKDCCSAIGYRTAFFVIVWEVSLAAETLAKPNHRFAKVFLSNCGSIFTYESYIHAD